MRPPTYVLYREVLAHCTAVYLELWLTSQVSVDHCYRVCQEIEVVAVVSDLLLLFVGLLLASATCRRVGANHFPVVVVVDGRDDELRSPVRVDKAPTAVHVDDAVVIRAVDRASQTISGSFHFALHYTTGNT